MDNHTLSQSIDATPSAEPSGVQNMPSNKAETDIREAMYNDGEIGPHTEIQISRERITILRGIMLDIDPGLFRDNFAFPKPSRSPKKFYTATLLPMLQRHPLLQHAEVRVSGTGLHVLLWFTEPVEFFSDGDRDRWEGITEAIQATLPSDPDAPSITALTRPLGSVNSKQENRGRKVAQLIAGTPVDPATAEAFVEELLTSTFKTVFRILTGQERIKPCPLCGEKQLDALDFHGRCYQGCGKVGLDQVYDSIFAPRKSQILTAREQSKCQ